MDFISSLEWSVWKKLSDQEKQYIFNQVTMYFISPLLKITDVRLADFELFGVKNRTFVLTINDEPFVFVPGNQEAILGWDSGIQGLQAIDLLVEAPKDINSLQPVELDYDFSNLEEINDYINDFTTSLRKVKIPPMLVQKEAIPAGTSSMGIFDMITGEFTGDLGFYNQYELQIKNIICPELSPTEALNWTYPEKVLKEGKFYLECRPNQDIYQIYQHHGWDFQEQVKNMHNYNFDLLSEEQWEFACGAGTRRLFRWGNEMVFDDSYVKKMIHKSLQASNMFGLSFDTSKTRFELTNDRSTHIKARQLQRSLLSHR